MNTKIVSIIAVAALLIVARPAHAQQEPTQREWNIYYDYAEKIYYVGTEDKEAFNNAFKAVAAEHGLTEEELDAAIEKVYAYGLTPEEDKIFDELNDRMIALGDNATQEQKDAVEMEIARKYGLSEARLFDIVGRAFPL